MTFLLMPKTLREWTLTIRLLKSYCLLSNCLPSFLRSLCRSIFHSCSLSLSLLLPPLFTQGDGEAAQYLRSWSHFTRIPGTAASMKQPCRCQLDPHLFKQTSSPQKSWPSHQQWCRDSGYTGHPLSFPTRLTARASLWKSGNDERLMITAPSHTHTRYSFMTCRILSSLQLKDSPYFPSFITHFTDWKTISQICSTNSKLEREFPEDKFVVVFF